MIDVNPMIKKDYDMAQATSGKIARTDWLPIWEDFTLMPTGIMNYCKCPASEIGFLVSYKNFE